MAGGNLRVRIEPMTPMRLAVDQNFQRHMEFYAQGGGTFAAHGEVQAIAGGADVTVLLDHGERVFVVTTRLALPWYGWVDDVDLVAREAS